MKKYPIRFVAILTLIIFTGLGSLAKADHPSYGDVESLARDFSWHVNDAYRTALHYRTYYDYAAFSTFARLRYQADDFHSQVQRYSNDYSYIQSRFDLLAASMRDAQSVVFSLNAYREWEFRRLWSDIESIYRELDEAVRSGDPFFPPQPQPGSFFLGTSGSVENGVTEVWPQVQVPVVRVEFTHTGGDSYIKFGMITVHTQDGQSIAFNSYSPTGKIRIGGSYTINLGQPTSIRKIDVHVFRETNGISAVGYRY